MKKLTTLLFTIVFICSCDYKDKNEGKILDDETFAEIQECITRNKIAFSKEIFEEGAEEDEQMIKDDIDRVTQQVIALCTNFGKETE